MRWSLKLGNFFGLVIRLGADEPALEKTAAADVAVDVREAMITQYRSLTPEQSLEVAVDFIRAGFDQDFPVTADGALVGLLTRNDLLVNFANLGRAAAVGDAMVKTFRTVEASDRLDAALGRFQEGTRTLPVVEGGRLVGLLCLDSAAEHVRLATKPKRESAPRAELEPRAVARTH